MHGKLDKVDQVGAEVCQDGQLCQRKNLHGTIGTIGTIEVKSVKSANSANARI
jgi:hypothetical protein